MSVRAMAWAWRVDGLPAAQKLVLLRLADAARDDGTEARPSVATIMRETGLGRTAVYQAIRSLEAAGHIEQAAAADRARHSPAVYKVLLQPLPGPPDGPGRVHEADPEHAPAESASVREANPAGYTSRTRPGPPDGPNPSDTHQIPVQERARAQGSLLANDDGGKPARSPKATRIDPSWQPSEDARVFAGQHGMSDSEVNREADRFRDYWLAKAGKDAVKLDWSATWRNWIRRASETPTRSGGAVRAEPARSRVEQVDDVFGAIRRRGPAI